MAARAAAAEPPNSPRPAFAPRFTRMNAAVAEAEQRIEDIRALDAPEINHDEEIHGTLWDYCRQESKFTDYTRFTEDQLTTLRRAMEPHILHHRSRGRLPKINYSDALIISLFWYNLALPFDTLASMLNIKLNTLRNSIERIRPILKDTLESRWWEERRRPEPLAGNHPYIALLCDSTSFEVYKPKVRFEEAKPYWDEKNHIYALKKEIAIRATEPHYSLFSQKGVLGSVHDYERFKQSYTTYLEYLVKTTEENQRLHTDQDNPTWGILLDMGYVGPADDTPGLRRITPKRNATAPGDIRRNRELHQLHVHVECFFGRLQSLWGVVRDVYRWDHETFDADVDICIMLTNEHIQHHSLEEIDAQFFRQVAQQRRIVAEEKKRKREAALERYKTKRRRLLARQV